MKRSLLLVAALLLSTSVYADRGHPVPDWSEELVDRQYELNAEIFNLGRVYADLKQEADDEVMLLLLQSIALQDELDSFDRSCVLSLPDLTQQIEVPQQIDDPHLNKVLAVFERLLRNPDASRVDVDVLRRLVAALQEGPRFGPQPKLADLLRGAFKWEQTDQFAFFWPKTAEALDDGLPLPHPKP